MQTWSLWDGQERLLIKLSEIATTKTINWAVLAAWFPEAFKLWCLCYFLLALLRARHVINIHVKEIESICWCLILARVSLHYSWQSDTSTQSALQPCKAIQQSMMFSHGVWKLNMMGNLYVLQSLQFAFTGLNYSRGNFKSICKCLLVE